MRSLEVTIAAALLVIGIGLLTMTFSSAFDVPTFGGDVGPAFAPRGYLIVWIVLAAVTLLQALKAEQSDEAEIGDVGRMAAVSAIGAVTGFAMIWVGFVFAAIPGFFLFCLTLGYRRFVILIVLSVLVPFAIWALFTFGFELLLPRSGWFGRL